jgi:hypothetical protein
MRRLALSLAVVLVALGCKQINPDYCADASGFNYSCSKRTAALDGKVERHDADDAVESRDAVDAGDAGDAMTDAIEAPAEKKPFCTVDGGECVSMADGGTALACDISGAAPRCVECVESSHCKGTSKPVCDTTAHRCVECVGGGAGECPDSKKSVCDTTAQKCVECLDDSKCAGAMPICDKATDTCRPCAADAECKSGPGICVDWDGHCAQAAEVVTLQGGVGCAPAAPLYCKASEASNALSAARPILLIKGTDPVAGIDPPTGVAAKVLIVGMPGANVNVGSGDPAGIHLSGATEYWLRDIAVSGGSTGIVVENAKLAHINRCTVTANGKGGIKTINSGFDITNTVIAGNMPGSDVGGVGFGGVRLGDVPTGGTGRFENNTVVGNQSYGVSCKSSQDVSTSIVYGNVSAETIGCTGAACCGTGDPMLDPSYRLKASSPCIDKLMATAMSVTTDIQGQPRPRPPAGKLDCGADELVP